MAGPSEILLRNVQIDETGCLLGALNKERNAIDFYTFEWQYDVEEPKRVKKDENGLDEMLKRAAQEEAKKAALEKEGKGANNKTCLCAIF